MNLIFRIAVFSVFLGVSAIAWAHDAVVVVPLGEDCPLCPPMETLCSGSCEDTQSSLVHCGDCDQACSGFCSEGNCFTQGICGGGQAPETEVCNAVDDDCDGVTDEDGAMNCDDSNECTADFCDSAGCINPFVMNGTSCSNGDGVCVNGSCQLAD